MTRGIQQFWRQAVLAISCTTALGVGSSAQAAPMYSARLLEVQAINPDEGPRPLATMARGINNAGQVVGSSGAGEAVLWNPGAALGQTLPDPRRPEQINGSPGANAINASGLVVGGGGGRVGGGLVWRNGVGTYVPGFYEALGVNDAGVVVGEGFVDYTSRAAQWSDGVFSLLPMPPDSLYGGANAINNLGVIAGWREADGRIATLWDNGVPRSLELAGVATAINDRGQVVGDLDAQGFLWSVDGLVALDPLAGGLARVRALNENGLIVGWSDVGDDPTATLWEAGQALDLNGLLAPGALGSDWFLRTAYDINDSGWIVGDAVNRRTGDVRGYVLTPLDAQAVPEPPMLALVGAALGLAALQRRRITRR